MKYLGVDWGLKKVGLALSEGQLASPLNSLQISSLEDGLNQLQKVIDSESIDVIVLGKPESGQSLKLVNQAEIKMRARGWQVKTFEETLTTQTAQKLQIEHGISQKARLDDNAYAAALILQDYLDEKVG